MYRCLVFLGALVLPVFVHGANLDQNVLLQNLQFNFANPGAKSLAMGGAFIGRADDASAAETNPAGLSAITRREATLELRSVEVSQSVNAGGLEPDFDFRDISERTTSAPAFASVVFPTTRGVYSVYYHKPIDFDLSLSTQRGIAVEDDEGFLYSFPGDFTARSEADTIGVAGAWRFGGVSVGAAARYQRLDVSSRSELFLANDEGDAPTFARLATEEATLEIDGSDSDTAFSVGVRWASPSDAFSIGGVYKSGAEFELEESAVTPAGGVTRLVSPFDTPAVLGVGISFRPMSALTVNVDAVNVEYSSLLRDFRPILRTNQAATEYSIDDTTELHAGFQWTLTRGTPIAIRGGVWQEPAHGLRYDSNVTTSQEASLARAIFTGGDDVTHLTAGIGFLGSVFEVNAGYDHSDAGDKMAVSALFRF